MRFVLFLAVASSTCFAKEVYTNQAPAIREINRTISSFVQDGTVSGAVTLVAHQGKVIHFAATGMADIDRRVPMRTSSLFAIASMTKPIVATGILILQDEGKLSVDDKVSKYIPEFANAKLANGTPLAREITIRECLSHTSGLHGHQLFKGSLEENAKSLASRPLAFQPRRQWRYSPGLNVAGRIIEIVSRQSLDKFLQERIFDPLEMKDTTFYPSVEQVERVATMYLPGETQALKANYGFLGQLAHVKAPNPSAGLISHARDMFRFYQMILNRGVYRGNRIVSAAAVRQMLKPQIGADDTGFTPGNCWGLGWCIVAKPQGVTEMLSPGTFGHGGAFGTQGWVDPTTETIYLLMIQRLELENSDGSEIRAAFQRTASHHLSSVNEIKTARAE